MAEQTVVLKSALIHIIRGHNTAEIRLEIDYQIV